jgi:hypothetical protein
MLLVSRFQGGASLALGCILLLLQSKLGNELREIGIIVHLCAVSEESRPILTA